MSIQPNGYKSKRLYYLRKKLCLAFVKKDSKYHQNQKLVRHVIKKYVLIYVQRVLNFNTGRVA